MVNPKRNTFQRGFERQGSILPIANHDIRQLTGKMLKVIRDGASEYQLLASTTFDQTAQDCANELVWELVVFPRINLARPATVECNVASHRWKSRLVLWMVLGQKDAEQHIANFRVRMQAMASCVTLSIG